jgi:hypothetical protein
VNNVEYKIDAKKEVLTITVKLGERHGLSTSGNTVTVAGTQGNQKIGVGDIAFGLNVYTKDGLEGERLKAAKAKGYETWEAYEKARKA